MRILMVGDVVGRPGRYFFMEQTPELKQAHKIDMVVVNGENAAHGKGLTPNIFDELTKGGADVVTTGNHIWDNSNVMQIIDTEPFLLRPANYPEDTPGKGFCIYPVGNKKVGVINMAGRTFMQPLDCPFRLADKILDFMEKDCDIILVDFHAEATSEKLAFANYLDGRVTAVVGTHTHVQTADEKILPKGTAYITDLGMVGSENSILGVKIEPVIKKFLTGGLPSRFEVAERPSIFCAVLIDINDKTNKATRIERLLVKENYAQKTNKTIDKIYDKKVGAM